MKNRGGMAGLIGATLCAYLVVLQAIVGSLAMGGHAASAGDPFSVLCKNLVVADDGTVDDKAASRSCCTLGCAPAALTPDHDPVVSVFRYDPRPTPRRALAQGDAPRPNAYINRLKRPRGPPSIG